MSTGLYRVYDIKRKNKHTHYEYRVKNKIVDKVIRDKNILSLKMKVQEAGLLWGITNIDEAIELATQNKIQPETLQGQYGKQIDKEA